MKYIDQKIHSIHPDFYWSTFWDLKVYTKQLINDFKIWK